MRSLPTLPAWPLAALLLGCWPWGSGSCQEDEAKAKAVAYVEAVFTKAGHRFHGGIICLQSDALTKAYPGLKFYRKNAHISGVAMPPGYPERAIVMRVDAEGSLSEIGTLESYNSGLKKPGPEEELAIAAAAVMSLIPVSYSQEPVAVSAVKVRRDGNSRVCTADTRNHVFEVVFDEEGRCTKANGRYTGPMAP